MKIKKSIILVLVIIGIIFIGFVCLKFIFSIDKNNVEIITEDLKEDDIKNVKNSNIDLNQIQEENQEMSLVEEDTISKINDGKDVEKECVDEEVNLDERFLEGNSEWLVDKVKLNFVKGDNDYTYIFKVSDQASIIQSKEPLGLAKVILKKGEKQILIYEYDEPRMATFPYNVYITNDPDVISIQGGFGDMGISFVWKKYVSISSEKTVVEIDDHNLGIDIIKGEHKNEITFDLDNCFDGNIEESELRGFLLNGNSIFNFESPFRLKCDLHSGIGSVYSPEPTIEDVAMNHSLSKISFFLTQYKGYKCAVSKDLVVIPLSWEEK